MAISKYVSAPGSKLVDHLLEILGMKGMSVKEFTLRCAVDEAVTVECEYYAQEPGEELLTKKFNLALVDAEETPDVPDPAGPIVPQPKPVRVS